MRGHVGVVSFDAAVVGALAEEEDGVDDDARVEFVAEASAHLEAAVAEGESDQASGALHKRYAVVQVKRACGVAATVRCDHEREVLFAQLGRGVCGFGPQRQDTAALDM